MIVRITENKKRFLNLLLLADEQESMINRYLERGEMFVLYKKEWQTHKSLPMKEIMFVK